MRLKKIAKQQRVHCSNSSPVELLASVLLAASSDFRLVTRVPGNYSPFRAQSLGAAVLTPGLSSRAELILGLNPGIHRKALLSRSRTKMKLSIIVALALANVAALPVPKASFLRGAREDEDTSSTHREGGRHVSFGRYAETPTPAPTYWASAVVTISPVPTPNSPVP